MSEEVAIVIHDSCPHCHTIQKYLEKKGLLDKVKIIDASTDEGMTFARKHDIRGVPECVVITKDGTQVRICSEDEFKKALGGE